jgi:putative ABC transport system ATP-binding protein
MSFISARNISKVFGESPKAVVALDDVSLDIEKGMFVAIMGPSGSGKTTLLNILGAMCPPTHGEVVIQGTSLYSLSVDELANFRALHLGFVFQQLYLLPYLSAIENVMLPLVTSKEYNSPQDIAYDALQHVGLENKAHRLPGELSTGEQARVAIARALVKAPPIILADEPTGNLDSKTGQDVVRLLQVANERGHTIILVTHNQDVARKARRFIYLRDGKIVTDNE